MLLERAPRHYVVAHVGAGQPDLPTLIEIQSFKELTGSVNTSGLQAEQNLCVIRFWLVGRASEPLGFCATRVYCVEPRILTK